MIDQGLQIESGTRIMDLLVPMTFRSSRTVLQRWNANFGKWAPVLSEKTMDRRRFGAVNP
jgi:hypothetical protein